MAISEKAQSPPRPEDPVTSIEDDGVISNDLWKGMMDVIMAIYNFREAE